MAAAATGGRNLSVPNDMQSVNDILRSLEEGSTMTAFFKTKKPETSLVRVKLETRELIGARIRGLLMLMLVMMLFCHLLQRLTRQCVRRNTM